MLAGLFLARYILFYRYGDHRDLHSFPTRRSSDLGNPLVNALDRARDNRDRSINIVNDAGVNFSDHDRSEEHTSELQSLAYLVCRLLLEKKNATMPSSVESQTLLWPSKSYCLYDIL